MRYFLFLIMISTFFSPTLASSAPNCLDTIKIESPSEKGLVLKAISRLQNEGWLPVKSKKIVQDLDQNGKNDFAFLLKKDNQLRVYVIWDGDRIMEAQCHSDLIEPQSIAEFADDPCKLKFEAFKDNNETGLLIRTRDTFTYRYLCRKFSKSGNDRIWHNVGTPD